MEDAFWKLWKFEKIGASEDFTAGMIVTEEEQVIASSGWRIIMA